jgi:hypothetical protein
MFAFQRKELLTTFLSFVFFLTSSPSVVNACGGFFCEPQQPVLQAAENIAFGVSRNQQDESMLDISMVVQINYVGPAEGFGWLLPVPKRPELSVGSDLLFQGLFDTTRPRFEFTIDNSASTTCSQQVLENQQCAPTPAPASSPGGLPVDADGGGVVVVERGTVGPFEFVILQAEENKPWAMFDWLEKEGFDQPEGSRPLVNYYATMGMYFVALRLEKQNEAGDIRPIILEYSMEGDLEEIPVACVPIQLTQIAATPNMPIQIYVLSDVRAFPLNYFHVSLDTSMVDWIRCSRQGQDCYLNDWRDLFKRVLDDIGGYGFTSEYAGQASIASGSIALDPNLDQLRNTQDSVMYLQRLDFLGTPASPLVNSIIDKYYTNTLPNNSQAPQVCRNLNNVYDARKFFIAASSRYCIDLFDKRHSHTLNHDFLYNLNVTKHNGKSLF